MSDTPAQLPEGHEERPCPEPGCDYVARGPVKGRGSVGWLLGGHRHRVHGYSSDAPKKKKGTEPVTEVDRAARPTLSIVREAAAEAGAGGTRKGVPTVDDLTKGLGRGLGLMTVAVASYMVETDPTIPYTEEGSAQRDGLVDYLSLSPKASQDVMAPIARVLQPTKLNRKYGRQIVDNVDAVASVAEIGTLVLHYRRYWNQRAARVAAMGGAPIDVPALEVSPPGPAAPVSPAAPPAAAGSPPPQGGHVVSAEEVQRMRGAK